MTGYGAAGEPGAEGIEPLDLAGVLCARLCHDMAGSLGALSGMLDLVAEAGPGGSEPEALALARSCARELTDRLRLLRAVWGRDTEVPALDSVLAGLPGADRLSVDLSGLDEALDDGTRQLALGLLLTAASALPRGGRIVLSGHAHFLSVEIAGVRAAWPESLEACLSGPAGLAEAGLEPRGVGAAVMCLQARALGLTLEIVSSVQLQAARQRR
jgi:histidine phosphotransferase ChpT